MSNSTHISNFGKFESNLQQYADMDGYLPLEGCDPWELKHDHAFQDNDPEYRTWWEEERWPEIIQATQKAIQESNASIQEWQGYSNIARIIDDGQVKISIEQHSDGLIWIDTSEAFTQGDSSDEEMREEGYMPVTEKFPNASFEIVVHEDVRENGYWPLEYSEIQDLWIQS